MDDKREEAEALLAGTGLCDRLGFVLRFAQNVAWSDLVAAFEPFGLRPGHYSALLMLRARPGCRQQDIGEALRIQRPNLVAMIETLEQRGLVARGVNPADRRAYALSLTEAGAALLAAMDAANSAHEARLAAMLAPIEPATLLPGLRRLAGFGGEE
ncbi:MAG TPA: MarR family transcriptional regulator [Sphingomonadaceae bacterium]|nr:MarR family transcriptional regulator [Sphingomonadaceae bacterium]